MTKTIVLPLIITAVCQFAEADVTHATDTGFVSEHTLTLKGSPTEVYQALTQNIHHWWDAQHSYSAKAANFSLEAKAGGCFCEQLANGGSVEHMRVVFADPGKRLRLSGGLGPLQSMAVTGSMDFALQPGEDGNTILQYRYTVGGYTPTGLQGIATAVDQVQLGQLTRLRNYLATGTPTGN